MVPQRSVKVKLEVNFFLFCHVRMGRVALALHLYAFKPNNKLLYCFGKLFWHSSCYHYTMAIHCKTPSFFRALLQPPSLLTKISYFQHACCMTQKLRTLPYNYQSTEKPLFAALLICWKMSSTQGYSLQQVHFFSWKINCFNKFFNQILVVLYFFAST